MTTSTFTVSRTSRCWPDDPDYLDGRTEIRLPSERLLQAFWDAEVLDANGVPPASILSVSDDFFVRFRLEFTGALWTCISGDWVFDVGFTPIGKGAGFDLSDHLAADTLAVRDWSGRGAACVELNVRVPAQTVPVEYGGTLYEAGAKFQLHSGGAPASVVGYELVGEYQFYVP